MNHEWSKKKYKDNCNNMKKKIEKGKDELWED